MLGLEPGLGSVEVPSALSAETELPERSAGPPTASAVSPQLVVFELPILHSHCCLHRIETQGLSVTKQREFGYDIIQS